MMMDDDLVSLANPAEANWVWTEDADWIDDSRSDGPFRCHIPAGVTVRLKGVIDRPMQWLRIDGALIVDATATTGLSADLIVIGSSGSLYTSDVIDADHPFTIEITANEPLDDVQLGRGLVSLGKVVLEGVGRPCLHVAHALMAGHASLEAPSNWRVGDRIVIPGTRSNVEDEHEERTISRIMDGRAVWDEPLRFDHPIPRGLSSIPVINVCRNITIRSADASDLMRRGHVMFAKSSSVILRGVAFHDLGRTDKRYPIGPDNVSGRYACHFHRCDRYGPPAEVSGCVVRSSPGWGIVNHSSYVIASGCVSFDVLGAHYVSEAGDEIGSFTDCVGIRAEGSRESMGPGAIDSRVTFGGDGGHTGVIFWLQSPRVRSRSCVAIGAAGPGFVYWTKGLVEPDLGVASFPTDLLPNDLRFLAKGQPTCDIGKLPVAEVSGNISFACGGHLSLARTCGTLPQRHWDEVESVIEGGVSSNVGMYLSGPNRQRIDHDFPYPIHDHHRYGLNVAHKGISSYGDGGSVGHHSNHDEFNIRFIDCRFEDHSIAIVAPHRGYLTISNCSFVNNGVDLFIPHARSMSAAGWVPRYIYADRKIRVVLAANSIDWNIKDNFDVLGGEYQVIGYFEQDRIVMAGEQLYFFDQDPDYIPIPGDQIPAFKGKTNRQLLEEFGLCVGGALALPDGRMAAYPPVLKRISPSIAPAGQDYTLTYSTAYGGYVMHKTPVTLDPGWNVLTVQHGGVPRSFLVWGRS